MRHKERIPILIEKLPLKWFVKDLGQELCISPDLDQVEEYWLANPDLRLTQVLVNMGYLKNNPGLWYYVEEIDWMINKGILQPREITFWGVNFTKEGLPLKETKWTRICDLGTDHIKNIVVGGYADRSLKMKSMLQEELRMRNFSKLLDAAV